MTAERQSSELAQEFQRLYGARARIFSAPGRVNLIGEHTDYNDGFVMPSALGFSTKVAIAASNDHKLVLRSREFPDQFEFETTRLPASRTGAWCDYVLGVAVMLQRSGHPISGAHLLIDGDVPIGAGLSSSAAIEVASALAFMSLSGTKLPLVEVAKLCR
ncbi:MAG TPA: galactokinase family protein, partial [Terriglobales bacterium]